MKSCACCHTVCNDVAPHCPYCGQASWEQGERQDVAEVVAEVVALEPATRQRRKRPQVSS